MSTSKAWTKDVTLRD